MRNAWESPCRRLADALLEACAGALPDAELRVDARVKDMYAEEEDPNVVPNWQIGSFYRFRVQERVTRHLFGLKFLRWRNWVTLVEFHMEEMWSAPRWAEREGIRSFILDPRVVDAATPVIQAFALEHRLLLREAWNAKDP